MGTREKIIVLDDDPTGSQTVHSCLLLTRWDVETLKQGLHDAAPLFFILINTRAMDGARATEVLREACRNLKQALVDTAIQPIIVSRSDSTLRGHYPLETDVITQELGPFDAHFLVPAFFEGGRVTRDSVHYLNIDGRETPVHETEFACDSVFGYQHSYLPAYVEEKTQGRIKAGEVERFLLADIRQGILERLLALKRNRCAVVDAENYRDLHHFAAEARAAMQHGKRFLFRSAASWVAALAQPPPQPVNPAHMAQFNRHGRPGAIIAGSHVAKTSRQLTRLLQQANTIGIEIDVERLPAAHARIVDEASAAAQHAFNMGKTSVIYTSRVERHFPDQHERLAFGEAISRLLMEVVRGLPGNLGFLISKGGITSNDILSKGLNLNAARLLGQIAPGCSVLRCPADHERFPNLPLVIFPGNVGDDDTLALVYRRLSLQHNTMGITNA